MCASCGVSSRLGGGAAFADVLAGGDQLATRPFRESVSAHLDEALMSGTQLLAGLRASVFSSQPFTVKELAPGEVGPQRCVGKAPDRLSVALIGRVAGAHQCSPACFDAGGPLRSDDREGREPLHRIRRQVDAPDSGRCLDQLGQREGGDDHGFVGHLSCRRERM